MRTTAILLLTLSACAQTLPFNAGIDAVAVDAAGFIYVAGTTTAPLANTPGVFLIPGACLQAGCLTGYLAKLTASGNIVWTSYLGTVQPAHYTALAVAPNQSVYVAHSSQVSASPPALSGYQSAPADIFILEISSDGKSLLAGTYMGGAGDAVKVLRTDAAGDIYLAGQAVSSQFPTTAGAYQRATPTGGGQDICSGPGDQFVAKFDGSLKRLIFSTLIATAGADRTSDFALGPDGSLYVLGQKSSAHLFNCFATTLTRLTPDAGALIYSVSVNDPNFEGLAVAVDSDGYAYASGDNRQFSPPFRGSVKRIDPKGNVVASQALAGSLAISGNDLIILGATATGGSGMVPVTPDSPPTCTEPDPTGFSALPLIARLDKVSLSIKYAGHLPAWAGWLAAPERMVVRRPYASATSLAVLPAGPPPPGTITCVADAGMYMGWGIAPGEVLSFFGNQIGPPVPVTAGFDASGKVTTNIGGFEVLADGAPMPLLYAGSNQINLVAPFALVPGRIAHLEVRRNGTAIAAYDAEIVSQRPGLFTMDGTGTGPLAALNQDGSVNTAAQPAARGSVVALFATGLGAMIPEPVDGSRPLDIASHPVAIYQVLVGTSLAQIEYIGNAPGLVQGVVQINVRLPAGAYSGPTPIRLMTTTSEGYGLQVGGQIFLD